MSYSGFVKQRMITWLPSRRILVLVICHLCQNKVRHYPLLCLHSPLDGLSPGEGGVVVGGVLLH